MDNEKKYSVIGKVEIGTDEYRDLIESVKNAERELSEERQSRWRESSRANETEKKLKEMSKEYEQMKEFIASPEIKNQYRLFILEKLSKEHTEDE